MPSSACQLLQQSISKAMALMDEQHCTLQMKRSKHSASDSPQNRFSAEFRWQITHPEIVTLGAL